MTQQNGKVAIVTGASSGIGKSTARQLLERGYRVHAAARRTEAMADLGALGAAVHHLDLTNPESIEAFMAEVLRDGGRVDLLVNNAGYGCYGAVEDVPLGDARAQMEVNLFGLAHLIQLALPGMRARRSGTIVNVTSIGGKMTSMLGAWYHASKFAVEGLSDALRNEVRPFGIRVIVVEPGGTKTEWGSVAMDNARRVTGASAYAPIFDAAAPLFTRDSGLQTADDVAAVIVRASLASRPKARYVTSGFARAILTLRWLLPDAAFDGLTDRLFRVPKRLPQS